MEVSPGTDSEPIGRPPAALSVRRLSPTEFRERLPELIRLYIAAMRYPNQVLGPRLPLWAEHSRREGFACVVAETPEGRAVGLGYGYRGRSGQWWYSEVFRGLGGESERWLEDYFELTELHVQPDAQGAGTGQALLTSLLADRVETLVLLSTPEGTNRAWRLYRRMGFVDVLREYRFTGDPRPFAVLGRPLPLVTPDPDGQQPATAR